MYWPHPDDDSAGQQGSAGPPESLDDRLARLVAGRLNDDPHTSGQRITVSAQNRVVILTGSVQSVELADLAGEKAWETPGIFDVCNALTWPARYW